MSVKQGKTATKGLKRAHTTKDIWLEAFGSLVIIALIVGGKSQVEHLGFFRLFDIYGHSLIQKDLVGDPGDSPPEVVVVDIHGLKASTPIGEDLSPSEDFTPRAELGKVVEAIALHNPRAIGIDVDFSKDDHGMNPEGTENFIAKAASLSGKIPVILGVDRQKDNVEDLWLFKPEFKSLAATISLATTSSEFSDYTQAPLWRKNDNAKAELPGFGARLGAYIKGAPPAPPANTWFFEYTYHVRDEKKGIELGLFNINTGSLGRIVDRVISYHEAISPHARARLVNRVVILGEATESADTFPLWGIRRDPVPGVLIHACAAETRSTHFFAKPSHYGRIVLDLVFSGIVLGGVVGIRLFTRGKVGSHMAQTAMTAISVFIIIFLGYTLASYARLLWTDFVIVALSLVVHPFFEELFHGIFHLVKRPAHG